NKTIPFFVPLRRYAERDLPAPEEFLGEIGRHIADGMPKGWVHQQLRDGRAILLVDGVDELAASRREEVRAWLRRLVEQFPDARFIVASRPGAAQSDWLQGQNFKGLDLESMTRQDVRIFVERWHDAMRLLCVDDRGRKEIDEYQAGILDQLD